MTIAVPRPAATVVLIREGERADAIELLLVRRNDKVAFMAGAYVFPGGRVDSDDQARARELRGVITETARFIDLSPEDELGYRLAAVREIKEEADITVGVDELIPIAHWVTPAVETRRYDTRFFLARMPPGQVAKHDAGETTELVWLTPQDALDRCRANHIMLPPPTWTTVKRFARFATVGDAIAWARRATIVRIQPQFVTSEAQTMLTLPGDPLFPTIAGWDIPEETRFVLEEGKGWKPVRA